MFNKHAYLLYSSTLLYFTTYLYLQYIHECIIEQWKAGNWQSGRIASAFKNVGILTFGAHNQPSIMQYSKYYWIFLIKSVL